MPEETAELRIDGTAPGDHSVPVDVLVRMLNGLQQLALIFAAAGEHQPIQHRFKPSAELRSRFTLRCGVPQAGSYVMPVSLVDQAAQPELQQPPALFPKVYGFMDAASKDDAGRMTALLPDSRYRERALREVRSLAPKGGERWSGTFGVPGAAPVTIDAKLNRVVERLLAAGAEEQTVMTVTGELIRINFDENKLFIRYPVNGRQIECSYLPEIENDLLESRRDMIQVTGTFILDADGQPTRLTDVTRIEPIDLSPLTVDRIERGNRVLRANPPLKVEPHLDDETQQLYVVDEPSLDLHIYAYSREDLADELAEHLFFAWDAYAQASPDELTSKAEELRQLLLARFQEGA